MTKIPTPEKPEIKKKVGHFNVHYKDGNVKHHENKVERSNGPSQKKKESEKKIKKDIGSEAHKKQKPKNVPKETNNYQDIPDNINQQVYNAIPMDKPNVQVANGAEYQHIEQNKHQQPECYHNDNVNKNKKPPINNPEVKDDLYENLTYK
uniref:Uncharacterized protein n=1 Tax=Parastrongyloides trichosuri TaxID=131310 RepID=A0A0N4ZTP3_PARTI